MKNPFTKKSNSPKWSNSTKIIVAIIFIAAIIALLIRFSNLIPPIVAAFILTILLYPLAEFIKKRTKIPWTWSVGIIYFLTFALFVFLLTMGGIALVNQAQELIVFLEQVLIDLPRLLDDLTSKIIELGPLKLNLTKFNWNFISDQLLNILQPVLSRIGNIIGDLASGAINIISSLLLTLIISYLLMTETGGVRNRILNINIPNYQDDLVKIGKEINHIWNAFLRGQAIVFLVRTAIYIILLGSLGVRFFIGLSLLAAIGNFIPYIGVAIAWSIYFFVALFQGTTVFGLEPLPYALIVMGSGWLIDNIYDSVFTPKVMAGALKIHPATITIGALIGLNLFGILGVVLAAPFLATLKLVLHYTGRKLFDQDPWIDMEDQYFTGEDLPILGRLYQRTSGFVINRFQKIKKYFVKRKKRNGK